MAVEQEDRLEEPVDVAEPGRRYRSHINASMLDGMAVAHVQSDLIQHSDLPIFRSSLLLVIVDNETSWACLFLSRC